MKRLINGTCHVRRLKKEIAMSLSSLQRSRSRHISRACFETLEDRRLLSFSPATRFPVDRSPQAVATADFNNDGPAWRVPGSAGLFPWGAQERHQRDRERQRGKVPHRARVRRTCTMRVFQISAPIYRPSGSCRCGPSNRLPGRRALRSLRREVEAAKALGRCSTLTPLSQSADKRN